MSLRNTGLTFYEVINLDKLVKVRNDPFSSFPRTRESRKINPALETFYKTINLNPPKKIMIKSKITIRKYR